jgi:hypothetical protein
MKKCLLVLILLSQSAFAGVYDLKSFFQSKVGSWALVSGWSRDINSDGSSGDEHIMTHSIQRVTGSDTRWTVLQDFCNRTGNSELCGNSENNFQIENSNLYLIDTDHNIKRKVDVLYSTKTELSYRVDYDGMIFTVMEKISGRVLTETTQVELKGKVVNVGFHSSKFLGKNAIPRRLIH